MNPADNPENWVSLPSSNSEETMVSDNTIDCPFYSVVPTSNSERGDGEEGEPQSQQIYQLPPGESSPEVVETETESVGEQVEQKIDIEAILDSELDKVVTWELGMEATATEHQNLIADSYSIPTPDYNPEPNIEDPEQAEIRTEFAQLLELNQELRTANDDLYTHVEALKEALKDSEAALQRYKKRADVTESLLAQQNQELAAAQSQIASLFQQLETSQQNLQHQEALLETYRAHLETNQQKLAQLERECANLHANFQEKSQQLAHSEATCRELRTRLMRQQRQTLQFKAALEKCLETPLPDNEVSNHENIHSLLNRTQPIQPWSGETEESDNSIYPSIPKPSAAVPPWQPSTLSENTQPPVEDQTSLDNSAINITSSTDEPAREENNQQENPWENSCDSKAADPSILSESLTSLEAQIDSVIQMFFTAQTANFANSETEQPQNPSPEPETSTSHLEFDTPSPWDTPVNPPITANDINTITIDTDGNITDGIDQNHQQPVSHPATTKTDSDNTHITPTEDIWGDISNLTPEQISILQSPAISDIDDRNSPSPLVYPRRPPKGRKSLSSVELPNFRPHQK